MLTKSVGLIISAFIVSLSFAPMASACSPDGTGCDEEDPGDPPKIKGNNGLGNGDQTAPGNSFTNNKAENLAEAVGGGDHPSGKDQVPD
jgi:hypothetical protein